MNNFEEIINDVKRRFNIEINIEAYDFNLLESRPLSYIYEFIGSDDKRYILKISRSCRSCKDEFNTYSYLKNIGVRSLDPVIYSDKFNYLVTLKEDIVSFEKLIDEGFDLKENYKKLADYLVELDKLSVYVEKFDYDYYSNYLLTRIKKIKSLKNKKKLNTEKKINKILTLLKNKNIYYSLYLDLGFSNINITPDGHIIVIDMGDAKFQPIESKICSLCVIHKSLITKNFMFFHKKNFYLEIILNKYKNHNLNNRLIDIFNYIHSLNTIIYLEKDENNKSFMNKLINYIIIKRIIALI